MWAHIREEQGTGGSDFRMEISIFFTCLWLTSSLIPSRHSTREIYEKCPCHKTQGKTFWLDREPSHGTNTQIKPCMQDPQLERSVISDTLDTLPLILHSRSWRYLTDQYKVSDSCNEFPTYWHLDKTCNIWEICHFQSQCGAQSFQHAVLAQLGSFSVYVSGRTLRMLLASPVWRCFITVITPDGRYKAPITLIVTNSVNEHPQRRPRSMVQKGGLKTLNGTCLQISSWSMRLCT